MPDTKVSGRTVLDSIQKRVDRNRKDLLVYIHVPFCSSKCHFCDWVRDIPVKLLTAGESFRGRYVEALCRQIEFLGPELTRSGYVPRYIYWGGGTPSRLGVEDMERILGVLDSAFDLGQVRQHTMEVSPETLSPLKAKAYRCLGVDRISMGVQSLDERHLRIAGRSHRKPDVLGGIQALREAGFSNLNIDLISAFPGEQPEVLQETLRTAVDLGVEHISVYSYRASPKTVMAMQINKGLREALSADYMLSSYQQCCAELEKAGYTEYCYGYFSRMPETEFAAGVYGYALQGDTVGFGAGANSLLGQHQLRIDDDTMEDFIREPLMFDSCRPFSLADPDGFVPDLIGGALMTAEGLSFHHFRDRTGFEFAQVAELAPVKAFFRYLENCGAEIVWEADRVWVPVAQKSSAYISHLSYNMNLQLKTFLSTAPEELTAAIDG